MIRRTLLALPVVAATLIPWAGTAASVTRATTTVRGDTVVRVPSLSATSFRGPGPYVVGETTYTVHVAVEGYSTPVEVWYPAARKKGREAIYNISHWLPSALDAIVKSHPAAIAAVNYPSGGYTGATPANGRFPLVLFSHGAPGFRDQSTYLTSHLASWGFVVAAPDHPSYDLTTALNTYLGTPSTVTDPYASVQDLLATRQFFTTGSLGALKGHVDARRFVVIGHSAGGASAEELASYESSTTEANPLANPLAGFIGLSGASINAPVGVPRTLTGAYATIPTDPGILVTALNDEIWPSASIEQGYNSLTAPHRLIGLAGSGHQVFSDLCQIAPGEGGLIALANGLHLPLPAALTPLATDGCEAPDLPVTTLWPVIDQITVAGARWFLGFDASTAGLDNLGASYPGLVPTDTTSASS
jgi:dienelactone hydrolase